MVTPRFPQLVGGRHSSPGSPRGVVVLVTEDVLVVLDFVGLGVDERTGRLQVDVLDVVVVVFGNVVDTLIPLGSYNRRIQTVSFHGVRRLTIVVVN